MDSKTRIETAWSFKEPDRIPIEIDLPERLRNMPEAEKIFEFIDNEADNFKHVPLLNLGFFGIEVIGSHDETIEDIPGDFKRVMRTLCTAAGDFIAITRHEYDKIDEADYHWERRYINTLEDFARLAEAPRKKTMKYDKEVYLKACDKIGCRGMPFTGLSHPFGNLMRNSNMEEAYTWILSEKELFHKFLEKTNSQLLNTVLSLKNSGLKPVFVTWALEMLISPWLGMDAFDEFVLPYDKTIIDAIHEVGGRYRAHCHGKCGAYLDRFIEMGIDSLEPFEPYPYGDNILADIKKKSYGRILVSGNIPDQSFVFIDKAEVRKLVKTAISDAATGGGFTIKTTGEDGCISTATSREQQLKAIENTKAYMETALEFGKYPIKTG
jgi:hypothetical protein